MLAATEDLAWFAAPSPFDEARDILIAVGRWGADLALAILRAACAETFAEASVIASTFQDFFDPPFGLDRFSELCGMDPITDESAEGRIERALGYRGRFTDSSGLIDPAAIFGAFAHSEEPLQELGSAAAHYFAHLNCGAPPVVPPEMALLAMPAVALAVLDRPLLGHVTAARLCSRLNEAYINDAEKTVALVTRTQSEGPRILAAMRRLQIDAARVAAQSTADSETAAYDLVGAYKRLSEGSFRSYAWLVADLEELLATGATDTSAPLPMLGELEDRLASHGSDLTALTRSPIRRALRNAEAHEDYQYDHLTNSVVVHGNRVAVDDIVDSMTAMSATVAGLDAGIVAFCLAHDLWSNEAAMANVLPPWAALVVARAMFLISGVDLAEVSEGPVTIICLDTSDAPSLTDLLPSIAGASIVYPRAASLRITAADGRMLVEVARRYLDEFQQSDESVRGLVVIDTFHSLAVADTPGDADRLFGDALALMVRYICEYGVPLLHDENASLRQRADCFTLLLNHVLRFTDQAPPEYVAPSRDLRAARGACVSLSRGDRGALRRLGGHLESALSWSIARRVRLMDIAD